MTDIVTSDVRNDCQTMKFDATNYAPLNTTIMRDVPQIIGTRA